MARRKRDYYDVLGVSKAASDGEIKRAFRELARQHHPDVNPDRHDAGERFREINEAHTVLSDASQRARYDRWGHTDGSAEVSGFGAVVDAAQEVIQDVLRRRKVKQRGRDLRYTLEVTFEEAAFGCSKNITIPQPATEGQAGTTREFTVVVPVAAKDGSVKMIRGEGEPGRGGAAPGDLNVVVRVREHASFRRDGFDVRSAQSIAFTDAALGGVIEVATIDGPVKMRLPEGTQPGRLFRVRGKGVPHGPGKQAQRGDHLVEIAVTVPTNLSPRQRELIEELARSAGDLRPVAPKRGLIDRMRSLLDD
ncbi:MAG: DnaJ domain-containing protein [Kofleriaceae bacterium]|nr:DnaJ domain-containing protein [Kofleriaceae bacterium]